ncbi:MAG: ABC transporter permease subunit [Planctomycetota bacterium]|nr:ABC transporter permease subunit [Planctomycetota bacterium]
MYLFENPVLQRELLVNLRTIRAFVLLFSYNAILGLVVWMAWPQEQQLDLSNNPEKAQTLVQLFFLGQYVLATMMTPSFAAGTITGEKERKTYESLLASPLRPQAIVLGKLVASLAPLALLIFSSLPIVMLCLPLGGVSIYEVLAQYIGLIMAIFMFGMISVACSSFFQRTASALVVSYLMILAVNLLLFVIGGFSLTVLASSIGGADGNESRIRLMLFFVLFPLVSLALSSILFAITSRRLLRPPDVGSEGNEVVDIDQESRQAMGLIIQRDRFPDKLFAPAKRTTLLADGANPVFDKEMRSEIFAQGTLMLRLVIQLSMLLAIPLMACFLYVWTQYAAYYISYTLLFNMLVGPVFTAGSVTSERERETLDLLLTTIISPWEILWGKLVAGLRVSSVLTGFLLWPLLLAFVMGSFELSNILSVLSYVVIVALTCLTTASVALACSVMFKRTATSLMTTYSIIVLAFAVPLAMTKFVDVFLPNSPVTPVVHALSVISPIAAAFNVPMAFDMPGKEDIVGSWPLVLSYMGTAILINGCLLGAMIWLFNMRWRVAQ